MTHDHHRKYKVPIANVIKTVPIFLRETKDMITLNQWKRPYLIAAPRIETNFSGIMAINFHVNYLSSVNLEKA